MIDKKALPIQDRLNIIQKTLKVSKSQRNDFGGFNYRSCEDILEAVKPLLGELTLLMSDKVINVGDRYYIEATVRLSDGISEIRVYAYAREPLTKKGMDESQITGSTSSYARKYALNGLFAIDDTKDADSMDNTTKSVKDVVHKQTETVEDPTDAWDSSAPEPEPKPIVGGVKKICNLHKQYMNERVSKNKIDPNTGELKRYFAHENGDKLCFGSQEQFYNIPY